MFKQVIPLLTLMAIIFGSSSVDADFKHDVEGGRVIIKKLQNDILKKIKLNSIELSKAKAEFQEYYHEEVLPGLRNISQSIIASAIHWIDMDFDKKPELVFWTEGVSPSSWGSKEYLFIVKVSEKLQPIIIKEINLDSVSRSEKKYQHIRFWPEPNKNRAYNDNLRAVMSYANYGASGSQFINLELGWNRYEEKVYVHRFSTSFPISIESAKASPN